MLDIKRLRSNFEETKKLIEIRGKGDFGIGEVLELDEKRRVLIQNVEQMKNRQNTVSKEIPKLKKSGEDVSKILEEMKELATKIKELDSEVKEVEDGIREKLLSIPNTPHPGTPEGNSDEDNIVTKTWGEPNTFEFEHKAHWDIGMDLDILDFDRAAKITGSRFTVYKGKGAKLERA